MQRSEQINDLAAAMAKAQSEMDGAVKAANNPHFNRTYADLSSVWDAIREPLSKNGLSVTQWMRSSGSEGRNAVEVETFLMHASGQWISDTFAVPVSKVDAQGYGSACTYARRYALMAAVGIAPVDDDANAAVGGELPEQSSSERAPQSNKPACPKCGKPGFKDKEKENGFYCWKKKDGCGHTWTLGEPEPPKTNGKPADTPFDAAKTAVANCEYPRLIGLADQIYDSKKLEADHKVELFNLLATRAMTIGAEQPDLDAILKKTTEGIKEFSHTFAP